MPLSGQSVGPVPRNRHERFRSRIVTALMRQQRCHYSPAATASNADRSDLGNIRPRRSERRRIPAAAFGLKQNLDRAVLIVSKMSDNEDTRTSLGDSEVLSVQNPPADPHPELGQVPDDGCRNPVRR